MATPSLVDCLAFLFLLRISCFIYIRRCRRPENIPPPGPPRLPLVGNLFQLGGKFHRTLAKLAQIYGPIMTIKVLSKTMVVVSSPKMAKELIQKYDHTFTGRLVMDVWRAMDHHNHAVAILPSEKQWRNLHKLLKEHILSSERLNASQGLRQEKVQQLCDYIQSCCSNGEVVDIGEVAFRTTLNFLSTTLFSVDFVDYYSDSSNEILDALQGLQELIGKPNVVDVFPVFGWVDPQGIRRQTKFYSRKLLQTFDDIISERLGDRDPSSFATSSKSDLLAVFLEKCHQGDSNLSYNDIKHLILDLFLAGSHPSSITIEWVMAELLRNPEKMERAVREIRQLNAQCDQIQESDISRLPYLQAVVKETLRLHPPASLIGRQPSDDLQIDGYMVPKDAHIVLNLWHINRNSAAWTDADSFVPERFLDSKIEMKGQHFELLPFGAGRRVCPGMSLALRMVQLIIASLLCSFDWKLVNGINPEDMDMTETSGFIAHKALPLKLTPSRPTTLS